MLSRRNDRVRSHFFIGGDGAGAMFGPGLLMLFLRMQVSLVGMLEGSSGTFMAGRVIFLPVALGAAAMGVGRKVAVLGGYLLGFAHNHCQCTRNAVCGAGVDKGLPPGSRAEAVTWSAESAGRVQVSPPPMAAPSAVSARRRPAALPVASRW